MCLRCDPRHNPRQAQCAARLGCMSWVVFEAGSSSGKRVVLVCRGLSFRLAPRLSDEEPHECQLPDVLTCRLTTMGLATTSLTIMRPACMSSDVCRCNSLQRTWWLLPRRRRVFHRREKVFAMCPCLKEVSEIVLRTFCSTNLSSSPECFHTSRVCL